MNGHPAAMDVESRNFKSYEQVSKWWSRLISAGVVTAILVAVIALGIGIAALKEAQDNDTESTIVPAPAPNTRPATNSAEANAVEEETGAEQTETDAERPLPGSREYAGYQHTPAPPSRLYFDVVTHGHISETYFNLLQKGIDDAAQMLGVDVAYFGAETPEAAENHETIVERIVEARRQLKSGLAISFLEHDNEISEAVEEASYDMPVLSMLLDTDLYPDLNLETFANVGFSNEFAGFEAGRIFLDAGIDSALCLKSDEDVVGEATACEQLERGLGNGTVLTRTLDLSDDEFVADQIENAVNGGVRAILTLNEAAFEHARRFLNETGQLCSGQLTVNNSDCVMLGTFGESDAILQGILDGYVSFALDRQHYLQGYMAIMFLRVAATLRVSPGAGRPILSGPVVIRTAEEAERRMSRDIMQSETINGKEPADLKIRYLVHGKTSDPFWTAVKNGVRRAARETGVGIDFRHPDRATTTMDGIVDWQIEMLELAESDGVDAIVMTVPSNETDLAEAIRQLTDEAQIPVITINSGHRWFRELHVRAHIGTAERLDGRTVGNRLADVNVEKALCVIVEAGNPDLEERCEDVGRDSGIEVVVLDSFEGDDFHTDMPDRTRTITDAVVAALTGDEDLKAVVSTGLSATQGVREAIAELGRFCLGDDQPRRRNADSCVEFAAYDVDPLVYSYIKSGELLFAVDQQPVLQGYLPIYFAMIDVLYANRGFGLVATGPEIVDLTNVELEEELYGFLTAN